MFGLEGFGFRVEGFSVGIFLKRLDRAYIGSRESARTLRISVFISDNVVSRGLGFRVKGLGV